MIQKSPKHTLLMTSALLLNPLKYTFMIGELQRLSWLWPYGSLIYNYLCNRCLSPLILWVLLPLKSRCTTLWHKVCQWLAAGLWFSLSPPFSSNNKTDRHDITEILLKVALNTINLKKKSFSCVLYAQCCQWFWIVHSWLPLKFL